MPTYDYHCDANGQTVEVVHRMTEVINTWGELCEKAGIDPGKTSLETPVQKLMSGGNVVSSQNLGSGSAPVCNTGGCCGGGMCGMGN
jgi:predicted nucleic acid-binding Zn ribbon protein